MVAEFNKKIFFEHLILTFLIMGICWGLCVLCHSIFNSIGNFFHYDMYSNWLAATITTAVMILVSLLLIYLFRNRNIFMD